MDKTISLDTLKRLVVDPLKRLIDKKVDKKIVDEAIDILNVAKVDKIEGKGLSTEDFTTEEKEKLVGLSTEGLASEVYVNTKVGEVDTRIDEINAKVDKKVPDNDAAFMQLVTDEDGNAVWEDKTHYYLENLISETSNSKSSGDVTYKIGTAQYTYSGSILDVKYSDGTVYTYTFSETATAATITLYNKEDESVSITAKRATNRKTGAYYYSVQTDETPEYIKLYQLATKLLDEKYIPNTIARTADLPDKSQLLPASSTANQMLATDADGATKWVGFDSTLTQPNQAADAKAVGDAIEGLMEDIDALTNEIDTKDQQIGIIYNPATDSYIGTHTYDQLCALGTKLLEVMYYDSVVTNDNYQAAVNYMRTLSVKYNRNPVDSTGYLEFTFLNHENNGYIVIRVNSNNTIEKQ